MSENKTDLRIFATDPNAIDGRDKAGAAMLSKHEPEPLTAKMFSPFGVVEEVGVNAEDFEGAQEFARLYQEQRRARVQAIYGEAL